MALEQATMTNERVKLIFGDLVDSLRQLIVKHRITEPEYRSVIDLVGEMGRLGYEVPLWFDVFLGVTVDNVTYEHYNQMGGTPSNLLGPFYIDGAPARSRPYRLGRDSEPGDILFVSGQVRDAKSGAPILGALLDIWQTAGNGLYDHLDPDQPAFNMRGKLLADDDGSFEFRTVVPQPYEIPKDGPTGRILAMLGHHAWRPKHIHFKVSSDGYLPLTTQMYFEDDPWLHDDVVEGCPKPELVVQLRKHDSPEEFKSKNVDRPFCTAQFDFKLVPAS